MIVCVFRMESCFLCLEPAKQTCEKCRNFSFCGEEHYSLHVNGRDCFPYRLDTKENVGRYMVASRNIEPGELIFRLGVLFILFYFTECLLIILYNLGSKLWLWDPFMTARRSA